jgi:hypothetical protein
MRRSVIPLTCNIPTAPMCPGMIVCRTSKILVLQEALLYGMPNGFNGPQRREMAAYELNIKGLSFFNELRGNFSYQHIEESRNQREYRNYSNFDKRAEDLDVFGFTVDGRKFFGNNELIVGIDGQLNDLKSEGTRTNLNTGAVTKT